MGHVRLNSAASSRTLCDPQEADSPARTPRRTNHLYSHLYATSKRHFVATPGNTNSDESGDHDMFTATTTAHRTLATNAATDRKCRADTNVERQRVGDKAEEDNATTWQVATD